jgi:hypothetical protein
MQHAPPELTVPPASMQICGWQLLQHSGAGVGAGVGTGVGAMLGVTEGELVGAEHWLIRQSSTITPP